LILFFTLTALFSFITILLFHTNSFTNTKITSEGIITLCYFKSVLKVADEKELPIFCHKNHEDGTSLFFIVDGGYVYNDETIKSALIHSTEKGIISEKAYANG